jgi:hypothetical protein
MTPPNRLTDAERAASNDTGALQLRSRSTRLRARWRGLAVAAVAVTLIAGAVPGTIEARGERVPRRGVPTLFHVWWANARFHNIEVAERAGYSGDVVPMCMDDPALGGMGVHWIDVELLTDGKITPTRPEALVYEVGALGKKRLVAVEWVMPPNETFPPAPDGGTGPRLFGQQFTWHDDLEVWKLHAWLYRANPAGLFADYNPRVAPCPVGLSHEH